MHTVFSSSVDTFSIPFRYNVSLSETLNGLRRAQGGKFLDEQTRLVRLNAVVYFPAHDGFFAYVSSFVEFRSVGGVQTGQRLIPFKIVNFNKTRNRFVFALDVIIIISTAIMAVSYIRNIHLKWAMKQASKMNHITVFGIWEIFELCHLVALTIQSEKRGRMWYNGAHTTSNNFMDTMKDWSDTQDPAVAAYNFLVSYAVLTDKANVALSMAVVLSFLRLFKYAQFDPRLNALSETVKGAAFHLLVMTFIFLVVLVSFSLGGCILFGHALPEFRNFATSMSYLLRNLVSATMEKWDLLHNSRPTVSWVFLAVFFLISWLLLLNMVLAIIAESFAIVQESMSAVANEGEELTFLSAWASLKRTARGYVDTRHNRRHGVHLRGRLAAHAVAMEVLLGLDPASDQAVSLCQQIRAWSETSRRTLRTSRPDLPPSALTDARLYIRALQFRELCLSVSPPLTVSRELHRIFAAAQKQVVSGSSGRDREDARRFALMSEKIGEVDGRVMEARARAEAAQNDQAASLGHIAELLHEMMQQQREGAGGTTGGLARRKGLIKDGDGGPSSSPPPPPPPPADFSQNHMLDALLVGRAASRAAEHQSRPVTPPRSPRRAAPYEASPSPWTALRDQVFADDEPPVPPPPQPARYATFGSPVPQRDGDGDVGGSGSGDALPALQHPLLHGDVLAGAAGRGSSALSGGRGGGAVPPHLLAPSFGRGQVIPPPPAAAPRPPTRPAIA